MEKNFKIFFMGIIFFILLKIGIYNLLKNQNVNFKKEILTIIMIIIALIYISFFYKNDYTTNL